MKSFSPSGASHFRQSRSRNYQNPILRAAQLLAWSMCFIALFGFSTGYAQTLTDSEPGLLDGEWGVTAGFGYESSPRMAIGATWRISERLPRLKRPLQITAALTSPIWLLPQGDHMGGALGARWSAFTGAWRLDVSGWTGLQAWDNNIAHGSTWWLAGAVQPGWHRGRGFLGLRLGLRSSVLTNIRHEDTWTRWFDAKDGWYRGTTGAFDLALRGGARIGRIVQVEAEVGARMPLDFAPITPFEIPWIAGVRVVVAP